jgi:hypothetical protein
MTASRLPVISRRSASRAAAGRRAGVGKTAAKAIAGDWGGS